MIEVLRPGLQSTVQDAGRRARALGVPAGGAADAVARRLGNALVGNAPGAAGLEITLSGPTLLFHAPAVVSLCGAPFEATLDEDAFPLWRAMVVQARQTLRIGGAAAGARGFLAVRGGLRGQEVFGSVSTDLHGAFGGMDGRALRAGDRLAWVPQPEAAPLRAWIAPDLHTPVGPHHLLRVLATPDATPDVLDSVLEHTFTVSAQTDRMGARLGETVPAPHEPGRVSVPNVPGLLQLPPDGRPIVLLPDAGTHGGYPTPLAVVSADWPRLGQLRPGDRVQFRRVTPEQAHHALWIQERGLRLAELGLRLRR